MFWLLFEAFLALEASRRSTVEKLRQILVRCLGAAHPWQLICVVLCCCVHTHGLQLYSEKEAGCVFSRDSVSTDCLLSHTWPVFVELRSQLCSGLVTLVGWLEAKLL